MRIRSLRKMVAVLLWVALTPYWAVLAQPAASSPGQFEYLSFDPSPFDSQGTYLVPLRRTAEWLGTKLEVVGGEIILSSDSTTLRLRPGSAAASLDGQALTLPAPLAARAGVTFAPLVSLCEAFGGTAKWSDEERLYIVQAAGKQAKIVTGKMPRGQADVLWVTSVPLGVKVYADDGKVLGVTPFTVVVPPGAVTIVAGSPPEYSRSSPAKSYRGRVRYDADIDRHPSEMAVVVDSKGPRLRALNIPISTALQGWSGAPSQLTQGALAEFEKDTATAVALGSPGAKEEAETQAKVDWGAGRVSVWYTVTDINRTYRLVKQQGEQASLVILWQKRSSTLAQLMALTPDGDNFVFTDQELTGDLTKAGVSAQDLPVILDLLHRGGKVVCHTGNRKSVVEIVGENTWHITPL